MLLREIIYTSVFVWKRVLEIRMCEQATYHNSPALHFADGLRERSANGLGQKQRQRARHESRGGERAPRQPVHVFLLKR